MRPATRSLAVGALCLCGCLKQSGPTTRTPATAARDTRAATAATIDDPGTEGDGDFTVGPEYPKSPDLIYRGAPRGRRFDFTMASSDSKIFRGEDTTLKPEHQHPFTRKIAVYVPALYKDGTAAPILVIHDGPGHIERVSYALDNLTISTDPKRRLPPFIAIAVANGGSDSKGSERGLEYDTLSDRFARFIHDEVLLAVLANPDIKASYPHLSFTSDPWGRGVLGCSSGGAAAMTMGWFRPDLFRRIITYSGTFVDQQDDDAPEEAAFPLGAWEYHSSMKLVENSERKPLRIFTHVSERDLRPNDAEETHHNWVMANRRMSAALKAKGYHNRFVFSQDARHCDGRVFDLTLADTLVWMWRGYPE
jgi:enterochelin esterase-like enzyme